MVQNVCKRTQGYSLGIPSILVQAVGNGLPNGPIQSSSLEFRIDNIMFIYKAGRSKVLSMDNIKYNQEPLLHMFQFSSEKNTV